MGEWKEQTLIAKVDVVADEICRSVRIFAVEEPMRRVVNSIEKLDPQWVHRMDGRSLPTEVLPNYTSALMRPSALMTEPFATQENCSERPYSPDHLLRLP